MILELIPWGAWMRIFHSGLEISWVHKAESAAAAAMGETTEIQGCKRVEFGFTQNPNAYPTQ